MKQLVCLQIHNDYQISGGETKTAQLIANLLEKNGIKVIRYYKSNMEFADLKGKTSKIKQGMKSLYNVQTVKDINQILENNKIDFALVHNVVSVISNSAYKVLIKNNIPIIKYLQNYNLVCLNGALDNGTVCDKCQNNGLIGVKYKCYKESMLYSLIKFFIKKDMDIKILHKIKAFMPNSEFVMQEHVDRGIPKEKMHVMYNYVNIPFIGKQMKMGDYYLYFGRLSYEKGIMTTLKAFTKMRNKSLLVMGSGPLEKDVKKYIKDYNLQNVKYIGSYNGEKLLKIVADSKAVIVPSEWNEPLPRTILEAYSQGVPVIGSNKGGIPELISQGETGYVFQSGDINSLIEVVSQIELLDIKSYICMRKQCLDRLTKEYTEEAYFSRFMKCVEEII